jgi:hypothetical protein
MYNYNSHLWQQLKHMKRSRRTKKLRDKLARYLALSGKSVSRHVDHEIAMYEERNHGI